jgi:hypothetical protein
MSARTRQLSGVSRHFSRCSHLLAPFLALFRVGFAFGAHFGAVRIHLFALFLAFLGIASHLAFSSAARAHLLAASGPARIFPACGFSFPGTSAGCRRTIVDDWAPARFSSGIIGQCHAREQAQKAGIKTRERVFNFMKKTPLWLHQDCARGNSEVGGEFALMFVRPARPKANRVTQSAAAVTHESRDQV